ncbi:hypothetical protein AS850_02665 [Frondihabitans sp. 762G35]|uniref:tape measure protein n=1 Tax=Frondihabitans sp. 762G35 TaxID=1446794 RepID=UPI000D211781|nr:tape measure protein [Frondihabitans sp. 762G35]ARC55975.1 hypothetical protein AS850_02665 [Frondihabitans sp. 762G35]
MSESAVAYVSVVPAAKGFGTKLASDIDGQNVGSTVSRSLSKSFLSTVGGIAKTTTKVLGGGVAAAVAGIGAVAATKGLGRLLDIQDAQAKLKGLGHDATSVKTIMENALASVKGTAFGLGDAATVAASAVASGIKPGQDLTKYLKLTADTAVIAGTSLGDMGAIFNKTSSSGKVYTDTLNQLADRGVPIFTWLQQQYGVSADKLQEMVQKGQVDSATFRAAIEKNIGGAALAAADTNRGAWANVMAALGRVGAMFQSGAVAAGPKLFQAVSAAIDRAGVALQPFAEKVNTYVVKALTNLTAWINRVDFGRVIGGIQGVYDLVAKGDFTSQLAKAFHIQEDNSFVGFIIDTRKAVIGLFQALKSGDPGKVPQALGQVGTVIKPVLPFFLKVAQGLGSISGAAGEVVASGLPLLVPILKSFAEILGFVGQHTEILTPLIIALAAGFAVYKLAQAAANVATLASIPLQATRTAALFASAAANNALADATLIAAGAEKQGLIARLPATAAVVAQGIANVASRTAMLAGAAATGVATAAQWLFNAALTANPIGIIIVAVAALVAGLIWFFTQTKVGQAIWSGFVAFLAAAWEGIKVTFSAGIAFIGSIFSAGFNFLLQVGRSVFAGIVAVVGGYINIVKTVIGAGLAIVRAIFTGNWGAIPGIVSGAVSRILGIAGGMVSGILGSLGGVTRAFAGLQGKILGALASAGIWLLGIGRNLVDGLVNGIRNSWGLVTSVVQGLINKIPQVVRDALGIHSPSTVFFAIGGFVAQGLANGINQGAKGVQKAAVKMTSTILKAFNTKTISAKAKDALIGIVNRGNGQLSAAANTRKSITTRLAAATKSYNALVKQRADYKDSVKSGLTKFDATGYSSPTSLISALTRRVANTKQFATVMASLRKAGLDSATYQQFVAAGVDSLPQAKALLAGGSSSVRAVASLQGQLSAASDSLATSASNDLYGAGVEAARGIVRGLQSQQAAISKQMQTIASTMVTSIRKALDIHSPSRVMNKLVGVHVVGGIISGINDQASALASRMASLVDPSMVSTAGIGDYSGRYSSTALPRVSVATGGGSTDGTGNGADVPIQIDVHEATDGRATAQEVARRLKRKRI